MGTARIRTWLVRSRFGPLVLSAALASVAGLIVAAQVGDLRRARQQWGQTAVVWVARRAAAVGQPIDAEQRSYPRAVVPQRVISSEPNRAVARAPIEAGQILTSSAISPDGPAALLPPSWVAVTIGGPSSSGAGPFNVGDSVEIYAAGRRIAPGLIVLRSDDQVVIGVPADAAGQIGMAINASALTVALSASPPPGR